MKLRYRKNTISRLLRFAHCERGVVTVEWVALAAGLAVGAIAVSLVVMKGLVLPAQNIAKQLTISSP